MSEERTRSVDVYDGMAELAKGVSVLEIYWILQMVTSRVMTADRQTTHRMVDKIVTIANLRGREQMTTGIADTFEQLVKDFDSFVDVESTENESAKELSARMHSIYGAMRLQLSEHASVGDGEHDDEIEQDIVAMAKKYGEEYLLNYLLTRFVVGMTALQNMYFPQTDDKTTGHTGHQRPQQLTRPPLVPKRPGKYV
jgi:hypothetical protein